MSWIYRKNRAIEEAVEEGELVVIQNMSPKKVYRGRVAWYNGVDKTSLRLSITDPLPVTPGFDLDSFGGPGKAAYDRFLVIPSSLYRLKNDKHKLIDNHRPEQILGIGDLAIFSRECQGRTEFRTAGYYCGFSNQWLQLSSYDITLPGYETFLDNMYSLSQKTINTVRHLQRSEFTHWQKIPMQRLTR